MVASKHSIENNIRKTNLIIKLLVLFFVIFLSIFLILQYNISGSSTAEKKQLCEHLNENMTISGELGTIPILDLENPIVATDSCIKTIIKSNGQKLKKGKPVLLSVTVFDSRNGQKLTGDSPKIIADVLNKKIAEFHVYKKLLKSKIGERILSYLPNKSDDRIAGELSVIDILPLHVNLVSKDVAYLNSVNKTYTKDIETGEQLPAEVKIKNAKVSFGELKSHPSKSVAYILLKGKGQQLLKNTSPIAQYVAQNVDTKEIIETTYSNGIPKKLDLKKTYDVIGKLLVDEHVGSKVLLYLSEDDTDGKSPILMLVDILAVQK